MKTISVLRINTAIGCVPLHVVQAVTMISISRIHKCSPQWLILASLGLVYPSVALAKCSGLCELSVQSFKVEPPLACATFSEVFAQGCDCHVRFDVNNLRDCGWLRTIDFEFSHCFPTETTPEHCTELLAAQSGMVIVELTQTGETRKVFRVEDEAGLHTIELVATVEEFDDGSCRITPPKQTRGVWMWLWPLSAVGALVQRARRRRAHK